jgi:prevent-host-death family protein
MKTLQVADDIIPIGDLKSRAGRVLKQAREGGRPVVITQNGRPAGVLLSPEEFDRLQYRERFMAHLAEGLADADAGRVVDTDELNRRLHAKFGGYLDESG